MTTMRTGVLTLALALAAGSVGTAQNPYVRAGSNPGVANDLRARHVGDILTVTVQEQTSIKNEDKVERRNNTTLAARLEAYTLSEKTFLSSALPRMDVRKQQDFTGEAKQNSGSEVRASIAVVVVDVQPNGNLVIAGTRTVTVNDETRTLRISGLVRPLDVTPANTVGSAQVADARIAITGEGGNTQQVTRGPVGRLFDFLIWAAWPF
ncbi:MAG: flagellar basal body L-ring protein FlgH [Planctomycetes bacterium]|nr:flagellar basal body L-ring protein FlgH [Planctomycetota bacterium]